MSENRDKVYDPAQAKASRGPTPGNLKKRAGYHATTR